MLDLEKGSLGSYLCLHCGSPTHAWKDCPSNTYVLLVSPGGICRDMVGPNGCSNSRCTRKHPLSHRDGQTTFYAFGTDGKPLTTRASPVAASAPTSASMNTVALQTRAAPPPRST